MLVHIEDGMRVKHGTKARITVKSGKTVLENNWHDIDSIGGAITTISIMYNRLSNSGGVSWWNPATGQPITRPKYEIRVDKKSVLTGKEECDCDGCRD